MDEKLPTTNHKPQTNLGFTLIEALVAITIIGIIGFVLTDLLLKTFKGNNKTRLISKVVQNGQVALNNMSEAIRDADSLKCQTNNNIVLSSRGVFSRYAFSPPVSQVNGYIYKETLNVIKNPPNDNDFCTNQEITDVFTALSPVKLTDDSDSGVSVVSGSFSSISQQGKFKPSVTIQFQISAPVKAGTGFSEQLGGGGYIDFKTTVQLR